MIGLFNDACVIFFFLIFFIKAYAVGTHLNCLDKYIKAFVVGTHLNYSLRQLKSVPTTYGFYKEADKNTWL